MVKKIASFRLRDTTIEFIEKLSERTNTSKTQIVDIAFDILNDYFSDSQMDIEINTREIKDGRKKG